MISENHCRPFQLKTGHPRPVSATWKLFVLALQRFARFPLPQPGISVVPSGRQSRFLPRKTLPGCNARNWSASPKGVADSVHRSLTTETYEPPVPQCVHAVPVSHPGWEIFFSRGLTSETKISKRSEPDIGQIPGLIRALSPPPSKKKRNEPKNLLKTNEAAVGFVAQCRARTDDPDKWKKTSLFRVRAQTR